MLEWYEPSTRKALTAALAETIAPQIFLALIAWLLDVAPLPHLLLITLAGTPLAMIREQTDSCAAGAEWFAAKARWVRTYELVSVKVWKPFVSEMLVLEDSGGRKLRIRLETGRKNRDLWDLVYTGIAHSVEGGATIGPHTVAELRLPAPADDRTTSRS